MNEYGLNSIPENNRSPRKLDKDIPSKKNSESQPASDVSFKEVFKGVVNKAEGASEVRHDLIEKFKASLADGTYEVKAQELAEKMIQKIRENKTREIM